MRCPALAVLLALALSLPVAAQSQFADSAGTYVSVGGFPVAWGGSNVGLRLGTSVEVGRRFGNGVDAGLIGSYEAYGTRAEAWSVGATGGLTRPAPLGTVARLQATALYRSGDYDSADVSYGQTSVLGDVSATVGRSVPVVGSFRLQPTVGVFARVDQALTFRSEGFDPAIEPSFRPYALTGVQLELPLTFRLFGADATFAPGLRMGVGSRGWGRYASGVPGGAFRLNF